MSATEMTDLVERCSEEEYFALWRALLARSLPLDQLHTRTIDASFRAADRSRCVPWEVVRAGLIERGNEPDDPE